MIVDVVGTVGALIARPKDVRRLQIGGNFDVVPNWCTTDISPHVTVARIPFGASLLHRARKISDEQLARHQQGVYRQVYYMDLSERFPLPDSSVEAVFSSHVLEHLPPSIAEHALREILRVLIPGGIVRISVPDLDLLVDGYSPERAEEFALKIFETGQSNAKDRHYWMYNYLSLSQLLDRCGFVDIRREGYREGSCPDINVLDNRPESLFVEARK